MQVPITVTPYENQETKSGLLHSCRMEATLTIEGEHNNKQVAISSEISRYENEDKWLLDALFIEGIPQFVHGKGSRCCLKRGVSDTMVPYIEEAVTKGIVVGGVGHFSIT